MAKDDCHLLVEKLSFTGNAVGVYLRKIAGNTLRRKQVKFSPFKDEITKCSDARQYQK